MHKEQQLTNKSRSPWFCFWTTTTTTTTTTKTTRTNKQTRRRRRRRRQVRNSLLVTKMCFKPFCLFVRCKKTKKKKKKKKKKERKKLKNKKKQVAGNKSTQTDPVAKLSTYRASDCRSDGQGFKSRGHVGFIFALTRAGSAMGSPDRLLPRAGSA